MSSVLEQALEALQSLQEEKRDYMTINNLGDPTRETNYKLSVTAIAALKEAIAKQGEPVATLHVTMETHDMGQSLAPNPPFKCAIAYASKVAIDMPLGKHKLYTSAPTIPEGWQPIETAPKDGTEIIAWGEHLGHLVVGWDDTTQGPDFNWATADGLNYHKDAFAYWMPLPEAPKGEQP